MTAPIIRFRTLRGRLICVFVSLLVVLQAVTFLLVLKANRRNALQQIDKNLQAGARIFNALKRQRMEELSAQARLLAFDYGFKQAFSSSSNDPATMRLAMRNSRDRIHASFFVLVSLEGKTLFDSEEVERDGKEFDLPGLVAEAENSDNGETQGLALRDGKLYAVVLVPLLSPDPKAWICLGFRIDDRFARVLGSLSEQGVSFLQKEEGWRLLASTLKAPQAPALGPALAAAALPYDLTSDFRLGTTRFVCLVTELKVQNGQAVVLLQRDLDAELAPFKRVEGILAGVAVLGLALSAVAAVGIAKSVAEPLLRLTRETRLVEQGDYTAEAGPDIERPDEIGQLALSFRKMTAGLAERDHVRDLLGKVASPAIAAELARRGLTLGGEERQVTVLFCDLRDFTPLSERLSPHALLEILNHYFTRMSEIIDARGGVVDKFIGDAVMALFGAPVDLPGQADCALWAALEMRAALVELNRELFPGEDPVLRFGIGIHTAMVVAGNIGSPQRYNYTVVGDGVNIASRLEALTRNAAYASDILLSEATLAASTQPFATRPLGEVAVKGKQRLIAIHSLTAAGGGDPKAGGE